MGPHILPETLHVHKYLASYQFCGSFSVGRLCMAVRACVCVCVCNTFWLLTVIMLSFPSNGR